jgi:hypothetical protein
VEPWLNRALAFAKGAGIIDFDRGKSAKLTDQGLHVLARLYEDSGLLAEEKEFIDAVGAHATEANVEKIMRMELAL